MAEPAIVAEGLSKRYALGTRGAHDGLRDTVGLTFARADVLAGLGPVLVPYVLKFGPK